VGPSAAGSATALDEAYDRHAATHGLALRIAGDSRESAEITRDVFVELWQHPYRYTPGAVSPRGWLCGWAYRRAVDHARRLTP
jgi:DNA-directed RNA polymerase specialized sigma24 family protein